MRTARNLSAALQVVRAQKTRALLLALPVAASVALALGTLAIDQGLAAKAGEAARSFGQNVISVRSGQRVIAGQSGAFSTLTEDDEKALRERLLGRGAKAVEGTCVENNVPVSASGKNGVYQVFAVRPGWAEVRQFGAARGEFLDDTDARRRVCLLGQTAAHELFGGRDPIGEEVLINQESFKVKGVLVSKGASPAEGDRDARIVVPLLVYQRRKYQQRSLLDQLLVQSSSEAHDALDRLETEIRAVLREQHGLASGQADNFVIRRPEQIAEESRGVSRAVFLLLLGLAGVCALVTVVVIVVVSGQSLRARRGEIGLRRALGAMPADILQQVWFEGLAVSLLGGLCGLVLGLAGAWGLASWRQLAFRLDALVWAAPVAVIVLASLAGLFPARAAARLDPSDALRTQG